MVFRRLFIVIAVVLIAGMLSAYKLAADNRKTLVSPLITAGKNVGVSQWFPQNVLGVQIGAPEIGAKSAFFTDTKTGQVLYEKNSREKLPIASLAKIMTVVVALEHKNLDDKFVISQAAADIEPDKMWLIKGETLTLKELLYGVFLISANDAAETLAEATVGSKEEFVRLMNSKAVQLGMKETHFVNSTGLDEDGGNSFSSAYDMILLSRYALRQFPFLVDFSSAEHIVLPQTGTHQDYDMYSGINLLTTYPGVVGLKTGFTPEAGLTLVTLARKGGHEVLGVILGSQNRRDEAREILDYSFKKLGI